MIILLLVFIVILIAVNESILRTNLAYLKLVTLNVFLIPHTTNKISLNQFTKHIKHITAVSASSVKTKQTRKKSKSRE